MAIAEEALVKKVGGIVAVVAGAAGLVVTVTGTFLSTIVATFASSDAGYAMLLSGIGNATLCIAIIVLGRLAIKTTEMSAGNVRLYGLLLILCAVAASALLFWLPFVLLMAQVVVGATFVLLDKETPQYE